MADYKWNIGAYQADTPGSDYKWNVGADQHNPAAIVEMSATGGGAGGGTALLSMLLQLSATGGGTGTADAVLSLLFDLEAAGGGAGSGEGTLTVTAVLSGTGTGTGGGSATLTLAQWVRFLTDHESVRFTPEGGIAIRMVNGTGGPSVKGSVLSASTTADGTCIIQTDEFDAIGVMYDDGVPSGEECSVVVSGIAEVLLKDTTAATRGYWAKSSATNGRAEVTTSPAGIIDLLTSEHFREIGHCIESKGAGTDVLAKVVLHFN